MNAFLLVIELEWITSTYPKKRGKKKKCTVCSILHSVRYFKFLCIILHSNNSQKREEKEFCSSAIFYNITVLKNLIYKCLSFYIK